MVSDTCEWEILTIVVVYTASAEVGFSKGFPHAHILSSSELAIGTCMWQDFGQQHFLDKNHLARYPHRKVLCDNYIQNQASSKWSRQTQMTHRNCELNAVLASRQQGLVDNF